MEKNIMLMTLIIAVVFFIVGNPFTYAYVSKFTGLKVKNKKQHLMLVAIHSVVMSLVMFGVLSSLVIDKECPPPPPPKKCPPPPPPKKCPTCEKENDQPKKDKKNDSDDNSNKKRKPGQLSPEQVKSLLEAMNNQEKKVQDKINAKKAKGKPVINKKDW